MDTTQETTAATLPGGSCPVCLAAVACASDVEEAEVLACPDCQTALVVEFVYNGKVRFGRAPQIEEDWGQ